MKIIGFYFLGFGEQEEDISLEIGANCLMIVNLKYRLTVRVNYRFSYIGSHFSDAIPMTYIILKS
jgi:hypothetical protein